MFEEISFNGTRICDFKVDPRTVYASGLHTCANLIFTATPYNLSPIQLSANGKKHYSVVSHDLGLYLEKSRKYGGTYISQISCKGFLIRSWWKENSQIELTASLDYFKINALESGREEDIKLFVSGSVMLALHPVDAPTTQEYCLQIDGYVEAEFDLMYNIAQSDWIRNVLSKLGHRKFYFLELDLSHCEISTALEYISDLEKTLAEANYSNVGGKCRELMDYLEKAYLKLDNSDPRYVKWDRIRAYFKHFASLSLHQEEKKAKYGDDFSINRSDAEMIVVLAKLIVRYAQQLKTSIE